MIFTENFICHAEQCFTVRIAVEQRTSGILQPVKCTSDRNYIRPDADWIHSCKVLIVIFVVGEGLFIGKRVQVGGCDGGIRSKSCGILVKASLQLLRKHVSSVGTMIFTEFQAAPASILFDLLYADALVWFGDRNMACRLWFRKVK